MSVWKEEHAINLAGADAIRPPYRTGPSFGPSLKIHELNTTWVEGTSRPSAWQLLTATTRTWRRLRNTKGISVCEHKPRCTMKVTMTYPVFERNLWALMTRCWWDVMKFKSSAKSYWRYKNAKNTRKSKRNICLSKHKPRFKMNVTNIPWSALLSKSWYTANCNHSSPLY